MDGSAFSSPFQLYVLVRGSALGSSEASRQPLGHWAVPVKSDGPPCSCVGRVSLTCLQQVYSCELL